MSADPEHGDGLCDSPILRGAMGVVTPLLPVFDMVDVHGDAYSVRCCRAQITWASLFSASRWGPFLAR
eukprot:857831-Rhodomonas_salina.3